MKSSIKLEKKLELSNGVKNRKGMKYKLFFLSVGMFFIVLETQSQTLETNCLHYPYNTQVGINLNLNLLSKIRISTGQYHITPSDYFRSYPSFGGDLGVYLYQRVYKWFGVQIGLEHSSLTVSYGGTENLTEDKSIYMDYYCFGAWTFPILFNASYYFNGKHGIDISFGGAPLILFAGEAGWGCHFGSSYDKPDDGCYFRLDTEQPFNFSLYAKAGYNYLFRNKNTLGIAIVCSFAHRPYVEGYYEITKNNTIVEHGYTSLRNTFVGLRFSYGFTMKKLLCNESITTIK